jgi:hypothetical protein
MELSISLSSEMQQQQLSCPFHNTLRAGVFLQLPNALRLSSNIFFSFWIGKLVGVKMPAVQSLQLRSDDFFSIGREQSNASWLEDNGKLMQNTRGLSSPFSRFNAPLT